MADDEDGKNQEDLTESTKKETEEKEKQISLDDQLKTSLEKE